MRTKLNLQAMSFLSMKKMVLKLRTDLLLLDTDTEVFSVKAECL